MALATGNPSSQLTNWSLTRSGGRFAWYASSGWQGAPDSGSPTYNAQDGTYFLNVSEDLGGSSPEFSSSLTAYQSFSVTGGATYGVSFYEMAREASGTNNNLGLAAYLLAGTPSSSYPPTPTGATTMTGAGIDGDLLRVWHVAVDALDGRRQPFLDEVRVHVHAVGHRHGDAGFPRLSGWHPERQQWGTARQRERQPSSRARRPGVVGGRLDRSALLRVEEAEVAQFGIC